MSKSAAEKIGVIAGMRTILINAPAEFIKEIEAAGADLKFRLRGDFDYIHFFASSQKEFHLKFQKLKDHLNPKGKLWLSWRKNNKEGDLSLTTVIEIGYDYGLVESKTISIDSNWSAIKFTYPIAGKTYKNSYGKLKS